MSIAVFSVLALLCNGDARSQVPSRPDIEGSRWCVSDFRGGRILGFHNTPWHFNQGGQVAAPGFWEGIYRFRDDGQVTMVTFNQQQVPDTVLLQFLGRDHFIGWKDGATFRWGVRTNQNRC